MCTSSAPPPPAPDPRVGDAAMRQADLGGEYLDFAKQQGQEQAGLGRDYLAYAKEQGDKQAQLGRDYLDYAKEQGGKQADLGQQYLDFAKEQFAVSKEMQADLNATAKEASDFFLGMGKEDRARYEAVFKPLEDAYIKQASEWDSPARQDEMAAQARADVQSAAQMQRDASQRQMASMGVRPDSGRFAGVDRAVGLGTALGSVDAQNRARDAVRREGMAYKASAIGLGSNLPAAAGANVQAGLNAAGVPVATQMAPIGIMQGGYNTAAGGIASGAGITGAGYGGGMTGLSQQAATTGSGYGGAMTGLNQQATNVGAGFKGAMTGYDNMGDTLNDQRRTDVDIWRTEQQTDAANSAGIGRLAGTIIGTGLPLIFSSKKAKTDRKNVPEGDALSAVEKMPVQTYQYKPGLGDGGRHVGPMAENFAEATGRGDGKTIAVQDAIGITMGAVKDLSAKVDRMARMVGLGERARRPAMA